MKKSELAQECHFLFKIVKARRITMQMLHERTGYSKIHIRRSLDGKDMSANMVKELYRAIEEILEEESKEVSTFLDLIQVNISNFFVRLNKTH